MLMAGSGCAAGHAEPETGATAVPGFPVVIENCGRTLTFDAPPERVVTGYQPVLETLLALGVDDRIIGRVNFSENGPDGFLPGQRERYEQLPEISDSILFPDREVMLPLDADLVVTEGWYNFSESRGQVTIEELAEAGTQVYITGGWCDPESQRRFQIEDTLQDVIELGRIFGVPEQAEAVVDEMRQILDEVTAAVADRTPVPVLATDGGAGPVRVYGGAGLTHAMIEAAGGVNVLAAVEDDLFQANVEVVAATEPRAMIVTDYQPGPTAAEKFTEVAAIIPDSAAAREGTYLALPAVSQHPGYRNILAVREIAQFLHPEAFAG